MAEIDKGLPNVRQNVTIPSPQEQTEVKQNYKNQYPLLRIRR